jgi:predicted alpha/beta hydrolase
VTPGDSTGGGPTAAVTLVADDGFPLAATRFKATGARRGVALIAPATGVRQRYYARFATFLASRGWDVLTWDWRGVADSRHEIGWRDPRFTMRSWGTLDLRAAIDWADARARGAPVVLVGHSYGGQAPGLADNGARLDAMVFVGSQHGWLGNWPWPLRAPLWFFWHVVVPVLTGVLGRLPSTRIGLGEDLPFHVAREWARWCRRRSGLGEWEGHASLTAPILAYSFSDDLIAPRAAAEALLAKYTASRGVEHRHVEPHELGRDRIGHFGFFREGVAPGLWERCVEFLDASENAGTREGENARRRESEERER